MYLYIEPSNAYIFLIVINLFTGITCVESSFLLQVFSLEKGEEDLKYVYDTLKDIFLAFPPYCLGRGLIDIAYNDYYNSFYSKTGQIDKIKSPFEWDITTRNLVAMACIGSVSWVFTLLLEYNFFRFEWVPLLGTHLKRSASGSSFYRRPLKEDPDVAFERARVEVNFKNHATDRPPGMDRLVIKGLRKTYEKRTQCFFYCLLERFRAMIRRRPYKADEFVAVKDLTFGVPEGECFGLLGVNGAGKTTTFKVSIFFLLHLLMPNLGRSQIIYR
jgi:ATP-binding cassette subfamily A (ABC1) protein 2